MTTDGFSKKRLDRLRDVMTGHVESGDVPGLVTLVSTAAKFMSIRSAASHSMGRR
jgi:hypothetical protein